MVYWCGRLCQRIGDLALNGRHERILRIRNEDERAWRLVPRRSYSNVHTQMALTARLRKPDFDEPGDLTRVFSFIQLIPRINAPSWKTILHDIADTARTLFVTQPDRHYVLCVALMTERIIIINFNRMGAFISKRSTFTRTLLSLFVLLVVCIRCPEAVLALTLLLSSLNLLARIS